jgi:hypothetical protein
VRGIVILEVLRHIQQELGSGIKVQEFFDLIVGTRSVFPAHAHCHSMKCRRNYKRLTRATAPEES